MSALVVVESLFGNTDAVARAVAEGLRSAGDAVGEVRVVRADEAPAVLPDDVSLLLVGGPTHTFSMTRDATRAEAVKKGGDADRQDRGIREWIADVTPRGEVRVVTFDTRVKVKLMPGSAAKVAAKALRERGFAAERGETFWVEDTDGPLREGELERARAWGAQVATAG